MRLGFYESEDDLISVIGPLISLLDGSLDVIDQDQLNLSLRKKSSAAGGEEGPPKETGSSTSKKDNT